MWAASPNFWTGRAGLAPSVVVCHITDGGDPTGWFESEASGVSSHFCVLRSGKIMQYVHLSDSAWVNGIVTASRLPSWCPPGVNPNYYSVGIEHEGHPGDDLGEGVGCLSFAQFSASVALQLWLRGAVPSLQRWTGHFLFDPINRANCPGPNFPWSSLADAIGVTMPQTT